jgi:hypothetical protein
MNFTTPDLVAIRMKQLEREATEERLVRIARVTAWAQPPRRHSPVPSRNAHPVLPELQPRAPRL